jgi:hypothetical protein
MTYRPSSIADAYSAKVDTGFAAGISARLLIEAFSYGG